MSWSYKDYRVGDIPEIIIKDNLPEIPGVHINTPKKLARKGKYCPNKVLIHNPAMYNADEWHHVLVGTMGCIKCPCHGEVTSGLNMFKCYFDKEIINEL